jgi:hypothetical protein
MCPNWHFQVVQQGIQPGQDSSSGAPSWLIWREFGVFGSSNPQNNFVFVFLAKRAGQCLHNCGISKIEDGEFITFKKTHYIQVLLAQKKRKHKAIFWNEMIKKKVYF